MTAETYVPGEAYQIGWSHEIVLFYGVTTPVRLAHDWLSNHWKGFLLDANKRSRLKAD